MLLSEVESETANKLLISTMMSLPALSEGTKEDGEKHLQASCRRANDKSTLSWRAGWKEKEMTGWKVSRLKIFLTADVLQEILERYFLSLSVKQHICEALNSSSNGTYTCVCACTHTQRHTLTRILTHRLTTVYKADKVIQPMGTRYIHNMQAYLGKTPIYINSNSKRTLKVKIFYFCLYKFQDKQLWGQRFIYVESYIFIKYSLRKANSQS